MILGNVRKKFLLLQRVGAQTDVWPDAGSDEEVIIASAIAPSGRAIEVDGGYRLSGRWRCSSGCDDAGWTIMGAALDAEDAAPHRKLELLVPAADYRIEDTWFVAGLRGTGSNDLIVDEAFVPARIVLEDKDFDRIVAMIERPAAPVEALRELMRGEKT